MTQRLRVKRFDPLIDPLIVKMYLLKNVLKRQKELQLLIPKLLPKTVIPKLGLLKALMIPVLERGHWIIVVLEKISSVFVVLLVLLELLVSLIALLPNVYLYVALTLPLPHKGTSCVVDSSAAKCVPLCGNGRVNAGETC